MSDFQLEKRRVLVLGPHTDDEIWCGGTIARLIEEGSILHYACFSSCEESVPEGFDKDVLKREVLESIDNLGISRSNFFLYDFKVRHFPEKRQNILEELIKLRRVVSPDLVFLPASSDPHQDHEVISREGLRAFPTASVLGFEKPNTTVPVHHTCFVQLEERHIAKKIESVKSYKSQRVRIYVDEAVLRGMARVRGVQINKENAEAFEILRWVV